MDQTKFITEFVELIQTEDELGLTTNLAEIEEWDSLSAMVLIVFFEKKLNTKLTFEDIKKFKTVGDIYAYIPQT